MSFDLFNVYGPNDLIVFVDTLVFRSVLHLSRYEPV